MNRGKNARGSVAFCPQGVSSMPKDEGKWDRLADLALQLAEAESVVLIVLTAPGEGSGFSVSTRNPAFIPRLSELLRKTADEVDKIQALDAAERQGAS